jgi:hypothetical protein
MTGLDVGALVDLGGRATTTRSTTARVEKIGSCGYGACPHGDDCVTVRRTVGGFTTENRHRDGLTLIEEG